MCVYIFYKHYLVYIKKCLWFYANHQLYCIKAPVDLSVYISDQITDLQKKMVALKIVTVLQTGCRFSKGTLHKSHETRSSYVYWDAGKNIITVK